MPQHIAFVLPPDRARPTGGNLYNRFLIDALEASGRFAVTLDPAAVATGSIAESTAVVLDSALLDRMPAILCRVPATALKALLVHHLPSFEPGRESESRRSEIALTSEVDCFVATSEYSRRELERRFGTDKAIAVIPPALAVEPRQPQPRRPGDESLRALVVANFIPLKGLDRLLEVLDRELRGDDAFELEIVGRQDLDPVYAERCRRRVARSASLRRCVTLSDAVAPHDMAARYESSSVFLSTSEAETFGMALQEARAFGLPILAVEAGNVAAHVPSSESGRLFQSIDELVGDCLALARQPTSFGKIRNAAFRNRHIPDWNWSRAATGFAEFLAAQSRRLGLPDRD